jgi:hypothetical protein
MTKELVEFLRGYVEVAKPRQEWLFPSLGSRTGHVVAIEKAFKRVVTNAGMDPAQASGPPHLATYGHYSLGASGSRPAHHKTDFRP